MSSVQAQANSALVAWAPYLLVSYSYMVITSGDQQSFWKALAALITARLFFAIIEAIGASASWHLRGKKFLINKYLQMLRANGFPKRQYSHDNFTAYMQRIADDPDTPAPLPFLARDANQWLEVAEDVGILVGMRMHTAAEAALEIYSPRSEAPTFGAGNA